MKKELKILMLEDMEEDAHLVERTLRKEGFAFDWQCVDTHTEFVSALSEFKPDVILSDHAMPQFNSIEALKLLKHQGINVSVYSGYRNGFRRVCCKLFEVGRA
jgi:CheY-like chemotaxis protein